MIYEILNDKNEVINRIVADESFVEKEYPKKYRLVEEQPEITQTVKPETLEDKIEALTKKVDALIEGLK